MTKEFRALASDITPIVTNPAMGYAFDFLGKAGGGQVIFRKCFPDGVRFHGKCRRPAGGAGEITFIRSGCGYFVWN
jgi:hypothetical protein